jgi:hypothetical protein
MKTLAVFPRGKVSFLGNCLLVSLAGKSWIPLAVCVALFLPQAVWAQDAVPSVPTEAVEAPVEPPRAVQETARVQAAPTDVVRLHNGTFLRGTVVEQSATELVIMLPTGEVRRYPMSVIASVGPYEPRPAATPAPRVEVHIPSSPQASLHVRSEQRGLSLQRVQGSTMVTGWYRNQPTHSLVDDFAVICNAPCDIEMERGTYQLGVARGTGRAVRTGAPIDIRGTTTLTLHYDDREGLRIAGWVTFSLGSAGGLAAVVASLFVTSTAYDRFGIARSSINMPLLITGCVFLGAGMLVGLILGLQGDAAEIAQGRVRF